MKKTFYYVFDCRCFRTLADVKHHIWAHADYVLRNHFDGMTISGIFGRKDWQVKRISENQFTLKKI